MHSLMAIALLFPVGLGGSSRPGRMAPAQCRVETKAALEKLVRLEEAFKEQRGLARVTARIALGDRVAEMQRTRRELKDVDVKGLFDRCLCAVSLRGYQDFAESAMSSDISALTMFMGGVDAEFQTATGWDSMVALSWKTSEEWKTTVEADLAKLDPTGPAPRAKPRLKLTATPKLR
jgi:hypothetical protein